MGRWIVVALVIASLSASTFYYRAESLSKQVTIEKKVAEIAKINLEKQVLKASAEMNKKKMDTYMMLLDEAAEENKRLNGDIQLARQKMANHKLVQMRNSPHSERLLGTLNKSVDKKQTAWMQQ